MTQPSDFATNPEPAAESPAAESPAAAAPAASGGDGSVSAQASAVDLAFDQETGGRPQASQGDTRIGRVVSVSGSQVIVMLEIKHSRACKGRVKKSRSAVWSRCTPPPPRCSA